MPRKRQPLILDGLNVVLTAPGLKLIKRRGGRVEPRWVCSDEARRRGYTPRTVRLHGDMAKAPEAELIAQQCRKLWNEMLEWMGAGGGNTRLVYDGTLASLIKCYQTDQESPYRTVRANTRRGYDDWCRALARSFGARRLDRLNGQDLRRWYTTMAEPSTAGGKPRLRLASACVRSMMMILLNYGTEIGVPACLELVQTLERMTFRVPQHLLDQWNTMKPQQLAMTFAQAEAIVEEGMARGTRRYRSLALGVAFQFELTLAQIDVIGTWEKIERPHDLPSAAIARGRNIWRPGLRYEDFLPDMVLDMGRSKTSIRAAFDLSSYPLVVRTLAAIPELDRVGPVAVDDSGTPFHRRHYIDLYRELADARGVPAGVWNMMARHGGATEARAAGANIDDVTDHLQKTDVEGTRRNYVGSNVATTRRVAKARVDHRARKESA